MAGFGFFFGSGAGAETAAASWRVAEPESVGTVGAGFVTVGVDTGSGLTCGGFGVGCGVGVGLGFGFGFGAGVATGAGAGEACTAGCVTGIVRETRSLEADDVSSEAAAELPVEVEPTLWTARAWWTVMTSRLAEASGGRVTGTGVNVGAGFAAGRLAAGGGAAGTWAAVLGGAPVAIASDGVWCTGDFTVR
jgi:hypothetical protein